MLSPVLFSALSVAALIGLSKADVPATTTYDCTFTSPRTGAVYDFSSLRNDAQDYVAQEFNNNLFYYINVCRSLVNKSLCQNTPYTTTTGNSVDVCQTIPKVYDRVVGRVAAFQDYNNGVRLSFTRGDNFGSGTADRYGYIYFTCNLTAGRGYPVYRQENPYTFDWATSAACIVSRPAQSCAFPPAPQNGQVSSNSGDPFVQANGYAIYTCDPDYVTLTSNTRQCVNGEFTTAAPKCQPRQSIVANGSPCVYTYNQYADGPLLGNIFAVNSLTECCASCQRQRAAGCQAYRYNVVSSTVRRCQLMTSASGNTFTRSEVYTFGTITQDK